MAGIDLQTIEQDLARRFAAPLPEFYQRRIIFWYDEEREFEDQIGELSLDGVTIVALTGSNTFAVKKQLCEDDLTSNYLVYDPRPFTKDDDNWLINVQLYSEEFRADLNSIWMDEMGLPATPIIRNQVKKYRKFFSAKDRRDAVKKLMCDSYSVTQMILAVMAALSGCGRLQPSAVLRAVLDAGLEMETNSVYQSFVNYGADKAFWVMVAQGTGYNEGEDTSLGRLAIHLLLTAATRTMHTDLLAARAAFISIPHQAFCDECVSDWRHSQNTQNTACFPCIDECILISLMKKIGDHIIQAEYIRLVVEKRRTMPWYQSVASYYEGLLQVANMQAFFAEHSAGFHTVEPHRIWQEYTSDYYRMDTYYRLFHLCFQHSLMESHPALDDLFKQVADKVEGLYTHWFLGQLGHNWSVSCG